MSESSSQTAYQVLARKYRPSSFEDLLGHEAMVRTLRNAFEAERIAHAYVLTGVRGVGKTTTARILARALNYETDAINSPQIDMAEEGKHCRAIAESRHPDVIEMDAASRTGVGDIRELIESVRYAPTQARYKVYIIDEVHMLSTSAFNALLKTLEEPPPHVKFIFATTEIRKVPVTVLSRCQRFDLRRFDQEILAAYLGGIVEKEKAKVAKEGLLLIARAAEGSVRDALSLLDQAIIQHNASGGEEVGAELVQDMLGLADRDVSWQLLEAAMTGAAPEALKLFRGQYDAGADPVVVLRDLLELVHLLTRVKAAGDGAAGHGPAGSAEAKRASEMSGKFAMNGLTRSWSLLMKGLTETQSAPDAAASAEMALIRLCYAADLPTPDEAIRMLMADEGAAPMGNSVGAVRVSAGSSVAASSGNHVSTNALPQSGPSSSAGHHTSGGTMQAVGQPDPYKAPLQNQTPANAAFELNTLDDVVRLVTQKKDAMLRTQIERHVRLVSFEQGRIEFNPTPDTPQDLAGKLSKKLTEWTKRRWVVSVNSKVEGQGTLQEARNKLVYGHPLMKAALEAFPDVQTKDIRIREIKAPEIIAPNDDENEED